jgi:hypothetical protein
MEGRAPASLWPRQALEDIGRRRRAPRSIAGKLSLETQPRLGIRLHFV